MRIDILYVIRTTKMVMIGIIRNKNFTNISKVACVGLGILSIWTILEKDIVSKEGRAITPNSINLLFSTPNLKIKGSIMDMVQIPIEATNPVSTKFS